MTIREFIRESVLRPRLRERGCLVVYDPERRFRDLVAELGSDAIEVVDVSESSIESREQALHGLRELARPSGASEGLVIYAPTRKPEDDQQKQKDPFAVFGECGTVFPEDDGDEYLSLCLRAKPDHATEIRRVFGSNPSPSFAVIDAIGGGVNWPNLRAVLKVESARDVLLGLLAPNDDQARALKDQEGWPAEARDFLKATLGMAVKTRAKTLAPLQDELWRYVLVSELALELVEALPEALSGVPKAPPEAKLVISDVCERLRSDLRTRPLYIDRAQAVEGELDLPKVCSGLRDVGDRTTFPFEERLLLQQAIRCVVENRAEDARAIIARHSDSVWLGEGENQAQWTLLDAALGLVETCGDFDRQLADRAKAQDSLLDFYVQSLREADRRQREFEQAVGDLVDFPDALIDVLQKARAGYSALTEKVQVLFVKHLEAGGWPPAGRLANADVFDRFVAPRLQERGRRTAYLMVDALRYELGLALQKLLAEESQVELHAAHAQLPTITPVGMASLLPGAGSELLLTYKGDGLLPKLGDLPVGNVPQRMEAIRRRYGDRFAEATLGDFNRPKWKLGGTVELLVLRSQEIDSQLESNPETTLSLIPGVLKTIRVALNKLRNLGFSEAIIVSDHGFFLNAHAEAGDVCAKPAGNWPVVAHDRLMLGNGSPDAHSFVMPAEKLGIRGDFKQAAGPRSMAPYRAGHLYFHGGASLQEAIVPVLVVKLAQVTHAGAQEFRVYVGYRSGTTRITTRLPVIDLEVRTDSLFAAPGEPIEVLLEAHDAKGNIVGEAKQGGDVNPATRTIQVELGARKQVVLRMHPDFEGKFTVKALNPDTLATYASLPLETDYTV